MISDILSTSETVKKVGVGTSLIVLTVLCAVLFGMVYELRQVQADKRLAVVESRLDGIGQQLDRIENKLDRTLER